MGNTNIDAEKIFLKVIEKHTNINDFKSRCLLQDENEIKLIICEILELRKQKQ